MIQIRKFNGNGTFNLRSISGTREDWTKGPRRTDERMTDQCERLSWIHCPGCDSKHAAKGLKLRHKQGYFSKLKCRNCQEVSSTRTWLCECLHVWPRCLVHQHCVEAKVITSNVGKRHIDEHGIDAPLPKRRKLITEIHAADQNLLNPPAKRIRLNPGSKLVAPSPDKKSGLANPSNVRLYHTKRVI